jgi:hypothetical protein
MIPGFFMAEASKKTLEIWPLVWFNSGIRLFLQA